MGFPGSSDGKESACNAADLASIPGLGRSPRRREWLPTLVFLPGEFHGQSGVGDRLAPVWTYTISQLPLCISWGERWWDPVEEFITSPPFNLGNENNNRNRVNRESLSLVNISMNNHGQDKRGKKSVWVKNKGYTTHVQKRLLGVKTQRITPGHNESYSSWKPSLLDPSWLRCAYAPRGRILRQINQGGNKARWLAWGKTKNQKTSLW